MKKSGFTLVEVLLSLAIIGVIAAVAASSLVSLRPDRYKMRVIKCKNILERVNEELLENPSIYSLANGCDGLGCTDAPDDPDFDDLSGNSKYINLLARHLDTQGTYAKGGSVLSDRGGFTTRDGIYWIVSAQSSGLNYKVTLNVDIPNGHVCSFNSTSCTKPTVYDLRVNSNGSVEGIDAMSKAYFENPNKFNDRKADLARAKAIEAE